MVVIVADIYPISVQKPPLAQSLDQKAISGCETDLSYDGTKSGGRDWIAGMAEWESRESVESLCSTIEQLGWDWELWESPLLAVSRLVEIQKNSLREECSQWQGQDTLATRKIPILWNWVEGYQSRNRESYIPSLAEYMGFPCIGSDAHSHSLGLDKWATKVLVANSGLPIHMAHGNRTITAPRECDYPVFVKPRWEGSGMGISDESIIYEQNGWETVVQSEDWIWESYLPGREYTTCLLESVASENGQSNWDCVGAEIRYPGTVYGEATKRKDAMPETYHPIEDVSKKKELESLSIQLANVMGWEGFVRLDWKENAQGQVHFLEVNTTPGLSIHYSLFPKIWMDFRNKSYGELISDILQSALFNYSKKQRFAYGRSALKCFAR